VFWGRILKFRAKRSIPESQFVMSFSSSVQSSATVTYGGLSTLASSPKPFLPVTANSCPHEVLNIRCGRRKSHCRLQVIWLRFGLRWLRPASSGWNFPIRPTFHDFPSTELRHSNGCFGPHQVAETPVGRMSSHRHETSKKVMRGGNRDTYSSMVRNSPVVFSCKTPFHE
jgi:hypothetical protein